MRIFKTIQPLQKHLEQLRRDGFSIGFVPTMGALHDGHLTLMRQSKIENTVNICSIFVNPTQFNDPKDLLLYPRTIEADIERLLSIDNDILFLPSVETVYPPQLNTVVQLHFGSLDQPMEGKYRPGHFNGVAQVVQRLLDITQPDRLYMGQKDFQQYRIVRSMVEQLQLPVQVLLSPIVREKSGLAMSSRNVRLNPEQRQTAAKIYQTLLQTQQNFRKVPLDQLQRQAIATLNAVPDFTLDYFEIVDTETLLPADETTQHLVACVAVFIGQVRLIDNLILS